jgi:hypothetical protein
MRFFSVTFTVDTSSGLSYSKRLPFRVPSRDFRDFSLFTVASSRKTCPSARCASAANTVYEDNDIAHPEEK